jgi:hypothetical protein
MTKPSTQTVLSTKTIWTRIFIGLLSIQALLELIVGFTLLFNFPFALESGFGISYNNELDVLGIALGLYLLLLTSLLIFGAIWTKKSITSGPILGIITGVFLFVFGTITFLKFGSVQGLLVDGLRGLLTILIGYMALIEIKSRN